MSLIAFLTMFFANFAISWLIVIYIMDGTLKKALMGRDSPARADQPRCQEQGIRRGPPSGALRTPATSPLWGEVKTVCSRPHLGAKAAASTP